MFNAIIDNLPYLLKGFLINLELAACALTGGIFLGILVGLGRISKNVWVYHSVTLYVNFIRNIPLILVIFWFYFIMPILVGKPMHPFISAAISFVVFEATYFGEIFRAGFQSISRDLVSAAYATGLTSAQTARYILVPIAIRRMLPSMITQGIITFQDTSLAYVIGLQELVRRTTIVDSMEVRSIQLYSFVAALFFVVCFVGSRISRHYEMKSRKANIL